LEIIEEEINLNFEEFKISFKLNFKIIENNEEAWSEDNLNTY